MIFRRKILKKLKAWKTESQGRSALLMVEGARRVGKSFVVEQFGKSEYRSCVVIDFSSPLPNTLAAILNAPHDLDGFFTTVALEYRTRLYPRESLIVFDEVQLCPKARQMIKHLVADGRYDIVETGSLVTLKTMAKDILIPSEEERIEMHPMDFEEFCWALDDDVTVGFARECFARRKPLGALHSTVMKRYREYLCVGGMPQAVAEYRASRDLPRTDKVKRGILKLYRDDIGKFAKGNAAKVRRIFDEIPGQLSRKEKKYRLSSLEKSARMRTYEDAFMWLVDAKVVNPCYNATDPTVGMALSSDCATQKLYMGDTGLLMTLALGEAEAVDGELYKAIFTGDVYFNKGMIAENAVAQAFTASGRNLYFYSRAAAESRRTEIEIERRYVRLRSRAGTTELMSHLTSLHPDFQSVLVKVSSFIRGMSWSRTALCICRFTWPCSCSATGRKELHNENPMFVSYWRFGSVYV